jgi:hypothetical protein
MVSLTWIISTWLQATKDSTKFTSGSCAGQGVQITLYRQAYGFSLINDFSYGVTVVDDASGRIDDTTLEARVGALQSGLGNMES